MKFLVISTERFQEDHLINDFLRKRHEAVCTNFKPKKYWYKYFTIKKNFYLNINVYNIFHVQ